MSGRQPGRRRALGAAHGSSVTDRGLRVVDVTAGYGARTVLESVDLTLTPGTTLGISGASGSGKSTLARIAALLHSPGRGHVIVDGQVVDRTGYRARPDVRRRVGLVAQSPRQACDPRWTLRRSLTTPAALAAPRDRRRAAADAAVAQAHALGLPDDLLDRRPREVSDGQLQRLALARALALAPAYLVCDESTASLDAVSATVVLEHLARRTESGLGVLLVSHDRDLLAHFADEVVTVHGGRLR